MKSLPPLLQAHLASGTTTLCNCLRVTLKSGEKLGFTDCDVALVFDGMAFEADAGFTASSIESSLGLSVDNLEAQGALQSTKLDEARLNAGDFDHAQIEIWRVNWQDVSQRVLLRKGHLGEVSYGEGAFQAEVRGLSHLLNQQKGRLYQFGCDAELGDARCGVNLTNAAYVDGGTVAAVEDAALVLNGIVFADDWATRGKLTFTSGAAAGKAVGVKRQRSVGAQTRMELWQVLPFSVAVGDAVNLIAGCDKQFATCRAKFSNAANFRGFPHMPGTDFVASFAASGDTNNDGGKRST
jgi:uncharacterized phage protein (TIGR02218 family)